MQQPAERGGLNLLGFLLEGIEYAGRPDLGAVHKYVYGRNLAQTVALKAVQLSAQSRLDLLVCILGLVRDEIRWAFQWKACLQPHQVLARDIWEDQQAREAVAMLDGEVGLSLIHI